MCASDVRQANVIGTADNLALSWAIATASMCVAVNGAMRVMLEIAERRMCVQKFAVAAATWFAVFR